MQGGSPAAPGTAHASGADSAQREAPSGCGAAEPRRESSARSSGSDGGETRVLRSDGSDGSESDGDAPRERRERPAKPDAAAARAARKAAGRAAKAAAKEKRAAPADASFRPCHLCAGAHSLLIRCCVDASPAWRFVCGRCWVKVSGGVPDGDAAHPHYRYGGEWRAIKR